MNKGDRNRLEHFKNYGLFDGDSERLAKTELDALKNGDSWVRNLPPLAHGQLTQIYVFPADLINLFYSNGLARAVQSSFAFALGVDPTELWIVPAALHPLQAPISASHQLFQQTD